MTDEEIYQSIDEYKEEADALYDRIHEQVESNILRHAAAKKRKRKLTKVFSLAVTFVLILSLAIVLPIVLQSEEDTLVRYSDTELSSLILDYNLKEYARINKESFLYIDLYEIAEECKTTRYYHPDDERTTAYLQESFTHGETGYSIKLTIMRQKIIVEDYEGLILEPTKMNVSDVLVNYSISMTKAIVQFEYQDYKYYLEFGNVDEYFNVEFIAEIISNMFSTQQAVA